MEEAITSNLDAAKAPVAEGVDILTHELPNGQIAVGLALYGPNKSIMAIAPFSPALLLDCLISFLPAVRFAQEKEMENVKRRDEKRIISPGDAPLTPTEESAVRSAILRD